MPKKFAGENTKASTARARKQAVRDTAAEEKVRKQEDEYWKDDDKNLQKKQQRKEERERKAIEDRERKAEIKKLADEEMEKASVNASQKAAQSTKKLTHAEIAKYHEKQEELRRKEEVTSKLEKEKIVVIDHEAELPENVNRLIIEGDHARNVDEALQVLSNDADSGAGEDRHPEKRMRAAYIAFETKMLPKMKADNSNMRMSQLKQLLRKEWNKSPDNPVNQQMKFRT